MKTNSILKWKPIIDNLPIKNENIKNHLANYFEYLTSNSIDINIDEILSKINKPIRLEVMGKFFNIITSEFEYKLIDGTFVSINGVNFDISTKLILEIFGPEYLKYYDLKTYRDLKIKNILYGRIN